MINIDCAVCTGDRSTTRFGLKARANYHCIVKNLRHEVIADYLDTMRRQQTDRIDPVVGLFPPSILTHDNLADRRASFYHGCAKIRSFHPFNKRSKLIKNCGPIFDTVINDILRTYLPNSLKSLFRGRLRHNR